MRVGRYELEDRLLRPTWWGPAHRAIDTETNAHVMVTKVEDGLDDASHQRLARLRGVQAPNVMRVLDVVDDCVVSELVEGTTLAQLFAAKSSLDAQAIVDGVVAGLRALHARGMDHRVLCAEAIIVAKGVPVLFDVALGAAQIRMTPGVAPEQLRDEPGAIGPWSDVYALGALAYRLFTGLDPYRVDDPMALMRCVIQRDPIDFQPVAPKLRGFVESCLAAEPTRRPSLRSIPRLDGDPVIRYEGEDATEEALLETLRASPRDPAARQVYADWLEGRGEHDRATFVRHGRNTSGEPLWRAILDTPPVDRCVELALKCPKRWDALIPTSDDGRRHCAQCDQSVFFVTTASEARQRGERRECIAIDSALVKRDALDAYDAANPHRHMMIGSVAAIDPRHRPHRRQDELPDPDLVTGKTYGPERDDKPGLRDRMKRWFRR